MTAGALRRAYAALERIGAFVFRQMDGVAVRAWRSTRGLRAGERSGSMRWPVTPGAFVVGDPAAAVAVCALTSHELTRPIAGIPGVAIAGRLVTCNLGIEKIVLNVCANPNIRVLLVCGKDSPVFQPSQSLAALFQHGISADKSIVDAPGYLPVLQGLDAGAVDEFRRRIALVDRTGLTELTGIQREIAALVERFGTRSPADQFIAVSRPPLEEDARFKGLRPGGKRESLAYDPKGYLVFAIDREKNEIVARHYSPSAQPVHIMRGRSAEGMALALIREGVVTQMTHAAYVGGELAKAESALRFGMDYEQDCPLRQNA